MAKFFGKIGYSIITETAPGVWTEQITETDNIGELIRNTSKWSTSQNLNDNLSISNEISILADPYAVKNFQSMRYVIFMGSKWKITNVEVNYPRLILSIGGLYNG